MNEVDRTGEGITSLLYVYTFLSFVSADLSKKRKKKKSNFKYLSPYPPFKTQSAELKQNAGVLVNAFMNLNPRVSHFDLFQTPESDSPSTMCPAHPQLLSPLSHFYTPSQENIGCESHVCLFELLYTYMIYIKCIQMQICHCIL